MILLLTSCSTFVLDKSVIKKIEQHDEAANFLMLISDQENDLKETCQISPKEALDLLQPMHAIIDKDIVNGPHILTSDLEATCMASCHCGIYSDLTYSKIMKDSLFIKAQSTPRKNLIACAQKTAKWFCSSQLLEQLKSEAAASNVETPNGL